MLWRRYRWKSLLNRIRNRNYYTVDSNKTEKLKNDFSLARCLYAKIKSTGPITVADYMKEVLINPLAGYYMHKDVFGNTGDFITSPEVSQIFGELIAIWFLNEWSKVGSPKPVQIVELGPGRGTLSQDILRVFSHFNCLKAASLHLVEVSPTLSDIQARNLCMQSHIVPDKNSIIYRQGISHEGIPVNWYRHLSDVPNAFTLLVAHEFFDALPIHKFQKTDRGFREVLIDIQPGEAIAFRYVIANEETPAVKSFLNKIEKREHVEVSPESIILMQQIAERLEQNGGFGLIADYGHEGNGTDTFRAFKKHKLHDPLIDPGSADLTADVDFSALKKVRSNPCMAHLHLYFFLNRNCRR